VAIKTEFNITGNVQGDNVSTVFVLDLERDPYTIAIGTPVINWFAVDGKSTKASGIVGLDGNSYSLLDTKVTITFPTAPANTPTSAGFTFFLLFD
jgi:hypothetical protein